MIITVFTPTYNRGDLLPRVYNSLLNQTYSNFEWIIVDDGSTDDTIDFLHQWKLENKIKIDFQSQKNKGKHYAINKGVSMANGFLFFILDSDDELPENALEVVLENFNRIKGNPKIAGVAGRRIYKTGEIVGSSNFKDLISDSLSIRFKHNVTGDLVEVFKTDILREFPFPEIEGEKFCSESLVWNRIALKYKLFFFNKGIYITEYLPGGLTSKSVQIRMNSSQAAMLFYSELEKYDIPFFEAIKANVNFWRFSFNSNLSLKEKSNKVSILKSLIGLPIGFLFYLKDK